MILGVGIDIVELARIEHSLNRGSKLANRVLTSKEKETFLTLPAKRRVEFLAGRFAAKEAFAKALGTGISKECGWKDIEIVTETNGKPVIKYHDSNVYHLSISHSKHYAVAQVIIEAI